MKLVADGGLTVMETTWGVVMVSVAVPDLPELVAVMVVVPAGAPAGEVARPVALMVASAVVPDVHVVWAELVMSWVVPLLYVPVAVNCCVCPATMVGAPGVTAMETNVTVAGLTVSCAEPVTVPEAALMDTGPPAFTPVALPVLLTVAMVASDDDHVAVDEMSCVVPLLKVAVALNCWFAPMATVAVAGVTAMLVMVGASTPVSGGATN
jgi:hypothetical protein